jgi:Flp pilus assembly pilin Flp
MKKGCVMRKITAVIKEIWNDESGISSVEYALLLAFVAAGIIVAADALSNAVSNEMNQAANCIEGTAGNTAC